MWLVWQKGLNFKCYLIFSQFSSVAQLCPTLCDPINCSTPGLPVHHQLPEFTQTHVHWVGDAIQPSHPLSSPPLAPNPSQHQGLFQWVNSSHEVSRLPYRKIDSLTLWSCLTHFFTFSVWWTLFLPSILSSLRDFYWDQKKKEALSDGICGCNNHGNQSLPGATL